MKKSDTTLSKAKSYKEIGEFWDTHDLADYWARTKEVSFEIDINSETTYYAVEKSLSERLHIIAQKKGISANTLINLWVQEKLQEQKALN
jgi:predicted HicB family RNase H-like nuclease